MDHRRMLDWAVRNLDALEASQRAFYDADPYRLWSDEDEQTGESRLRISIAPSDPPDEWTFQIGDILHNMRVALDYLAFGHAYPRDPDILRDIKRLRNVAFPICEKATSWPGTAGRLGWASSNMVDGFERLQPYRRPDLANLHPLLMLDRLDKPHKHQSLLRAAPNVVNLDFEITDDPYRVAEVTRLGLEGPFQDGAVVARLRFKNDRISLPGVPPPPKAKVHFGISYEVAFGEGCAYNGFPAMPFLHEIAKHIRDDVFPVIEPLI